MMPGLKLRLLTDSEIVNGYDKPNKETIHDSFAKMYFNKNEKRTIEIKKVKILFNFIYTFDRI
jgi:hypothetical protein